MTDNTQPTSTVSVEGTAAPAVAAAVPAPASHLPDDMNQTIEHVAGDADYSIYVLDGQRAATTGNQDDWHDALLLIDLHSLDTSGASDGPVVKFTRDPNGVITFYNPLVAGGTLYRIEPSADLTEKPTITLVAT